MITIVTGPTHCGKSTYIKQHKQKIDYYIDILDFQVANNVDGLLEGQYQFYFRLEQMVRNNSKNKDIWVEGCFSNPYRIAQLIDTVRAANEEVKIQVIYILRDENWYFYNLEDPFTAVSAAAQLEMYKLYNGASAAVYKLNKNEELEKVN